MCRSTFFFTTGIAVMTMNKSPVNSLNLEYLKEFNNTITDLEKSCRGLILTSALPNVFCAGLDIYEMYKPDEDRLRQFFYQVQQMWINVYGSKMVTIAAINGHAPAGGCMMSVPCDYRIMVPNYSIGLNETQLVSGIYPPFWLCQMLGNTIGFRAAEKASQLGYMFNTEEAQQNGLIDQTVPKEQLMEVAKEEMKQWFTIPDTARQITKKQLRQPYIDQLMSNRETDIDKFTNHVINDSTQNKLQIYLEKLKKRKSN